MRNTILILRFLYRIDSGQAFFFHCQRNVFTTVSFGTKPNWSERVVTSYVYRFYVCFFLFYYPNENVAIQTKPGRYKYLILSFLTMLAKDTKRSVSSEPYDPSFLLWNSIFVTYIAGRFLKKAIFSGNRFKPKMKHLLAALIRISNLWRNKHTKLSLSKSRRHFDSIFEEIIELDRAF